MSLDGWTVFCFSIDWQQRLSKVSAYYQKAHINIDICPYANLFSPPCPESLAHKVWFIFNVLKMYPFPFILNQCWWVPHLSGEIACSQSTFPATTGTGTDPQHYKRTQGREEGAALPHTLTRSMAALCNCDHFDRHFNYMCYPTCPSFSILFLFHSMKWKAKELRCARSYDSFLSVWNKDWTTKCWEVL